MLKKFTIIFTVLGIILSPYSFDFPETNNLHAQTEIPCSETISQSTTWFASNSPYVIYGDYHLRILSGVVLTIEPGVTVKFSENGGLAVNGGEIIAKGTKEKPIIFTSNHGSSYPQPGGWSSIEVYNQGKITLDYAVVEYGGFIQCYEYLDNKIFKPNTALAQDYYYDDFTGAITISGSEANINNSIIASSTIGLKVMDFYGYSPSDYATSTVSVHNSEIYNNERYGILNEGSSPVDATNNWWGDDSGPKHPDNPDGLGDMVSDNVLYDPWTGQEEEDEIDPLILQYEPILYLHPNETYQPMNVEAYVNHCSLWDSHGKLGFDELLKPESEENPVILSDIAITTNSLDYYLQFSEDLLLKFPSPQKAETEYQKMKDNDMVKYSYYATKMIDKDEENNKEYIVLGYWFFYAFNNWQEKQGFNNHEGDWEGVVIFLDKETEEPKYIAYSAHYNKGRLENPIYQYNSIRRNWDSNEVNKIDNHIISFVAAGSHANYPNNGNSGKHHVLIWDNVVNLFFDDHTSDNGLHINDEIWQARNIFDYNQLPEWITNYSGKWGAVNNILGFNGCNHLYPGMYNRFTEPVKWAGIDKIGEKTVTEIGIDTFNFAKQNIKLAFDKVLNLGTTVIVDLHDEMIQFGNNIKDIVFLPHFWDIESNLENNTFNAEVSFEYNPDELDVLDIDENNLIVFNYNETNSFWEKIPSVLDAPNKLIKFFTTHFSRYAIGAELWQDITQDVKVIKMPSRYDRKTNIKQVKVKLKNTTNENITGDLRLIIKDINKQGVELVNTTGNTIDGYPYIEASEPYNHCIFAGDEQDIPEPLTKKGLLSRLIKRKIKQKKPLSKKLCEKIINQYSELEDKFQYVLPPKKLTQPIILEFSLPIKKTKIIKKRGKEITIYVPEFKNFKFEVEVFKEK